MTAGGEHPPPVRNGTGVWVRSVLAILAVTSIAVLAAWIAMVVKVSTLETKLTEIEKEDRSKLGKEVAANAATLVEIKAEQERRRGWVEDIAGNKTRIARLEGESKIPQENSNRILRLEKDLEHYQKSTDARMASLLRAIDELKKKTDDTAAQVLKQILEKMGLSKPDAPGKP